MLHNKSCKSIYYKYEEKSTNNTTKIASRRKREKGASTAYKSGCFGSELPSVVAEQEQSYQDVDNNEDSDTICEECK